MHKDGKTIAAVLTVTVLTGGVAIAENRSADHPRTDSDVTVDEAALYPEDLRRQMSEDDYRRYPGAGILFCRDDQGIPRRASTSWLIGSSKLVMMNAHNFFKSNAEVTRLVESCFFQIDGRNYSFARTGLTTGIGEDGGLHITDDWALAQLEQPVDGNTSPQRIPAPPSFSTGPASINVVMVSPAGHGNFPAQSSIEACQIRAVDAPTEDGIRRVRHNCNDGFGGSGSGLFDEAGHLVAMQSASLDMNRRMNFDINQHYGSALLIEGQLLKALIRRAQELQP